MTNALFLGTDEDKPYLPYLKGMFGGTATYFLTQPIELLMHLEMYCTQKKVTKVVSTNIQILSRLLALQANFKINPSLDDYQGSVFEHKGIEIVFISPLKQLFSVSYGKFIAERFISKVVAPEKWMEPTPFKWAMIDESNFDEVYFRLSHAKLIAVDIETFKKNLAIRCIGYTGVWIDKTGKVSTESYVLPLTTEFFLMVMRRINDLEVPKIFQNGKYDNAYLLRYNSPVRGWFHDTAHQFHAWYSELPKDLAFLNAFFLRKVVYWKDLAKTNDLREYYRYNALDTWATANVCIQWILTAPEWAKRNYTLAFPLVFPCLLSEMTGLKRDGDELIARRAELETEIQKDTASLHRMLGAPINANSPPQVKKVLRVLGCSDIDSTGEKQLLKAAYRHPLNARIFGTVLNIRGNRKLKGTYLRTDEDAKNAHIVDDPDELEGGSKDYHGRILYSLNPHGTDTARLASRDSAFWVGFNIQNIPVGTAIKSTICAEDGFYLGECDLEQAESRDTAFISGDEKLIAAVTGVDDFHSVNASAFFGIPYTELYDNATRKSKNKPLRDVSKRVNHGANYNMYEAMLVETMGLQAIYTAKRLLNLPYTNPLEIAGYLLGRFHATYTKLRGAETPYSAGTYYAWVVEQITISKRLASRAYHHTAYNESHYRPRDYIESGDWTRYCFGNPGKSKLDLNSYVAHCPQSLNARTLNEAYMRVFYDIALPNALNFRLHAQIHDSIFFSYRAGYKHLADKVRECMEIPVTVRDISGTYRTFTVPAALKLGKGEGAKYWSELE